MDKQLTPNYSYAEIRRRAVPTLPEHLAPKEAKPKRLRIKAIRKF